MDETHETSTYSVHEQIFDKIIIKLCGGHIIGTN